jgi:hypothetical protein
VKFTITYNPATGSGGANADLQDFYFNINPNTDPLSNLVITGAKVQEVTFTQKADGDGRFDYQVNFGNGGEKLKSTFFTVHLEGTDLSVANFADSTALTRSSPEDGNGTTWTVAAHFQNSTFCLPTSDSDFVGGNPGGLITDPVPIPPTALLLGSGLLGLGLIGWRRREKKA